MNFFKNWLRLDRIMVTPFGPPRREDGLTVVESCARASVADGEGQLLLVVLVCGTAAERQCKDSVSL